MNYFFMASQKFKNKQEENKMEVDGKYIMKIKGNNFITFNGLLDTAHKNGLLGLQVKSMQVNVENKFAWCEVEAVFKGDGEHLKRFSGIGSGNMENCSDFVKGHFVEMAHTRANARALRNALNIDMVALEELGQKEEEEKYKKEKKKYPDTVNGTPFNPDDLY